MAQKFVPNFCKLIFILSVIQIVASEYSMCDIVPHMEELNEKLTRLQHKLNLFDYFNETGIMPTIVRKVEASQRPPSNCEEAIRDHNESGVYQIYVPEFGFIALYCMADPNKGPAWTVLQRRVDNSTDFFRDWAEYKRGFGNLYSNFIVGLDIWHVLTTQSGPQELWVQLIDEKTVNAFYDRFAIGNETEKYALNISGKYKGDAGDALTYHSGMKFSTRDADNDIWPANCAHYYKSAWWYKDCFNCNLNGEYGTTVYGRGIIWNTFRVSTVSMKYAHMAIRPARMLN